MFLYCFINKNLDGINLKLKSDSFKWDQTSYLGIYAHPHKLVINLRGYKLTEVMLIEKLSISILRPLD
jgi:hypothetical protein